MLHPTLITEIARNDHRHQVHTAERRHQLRLFRRRPVEVDPERVAWSAPVVNLSARDRLPAPATRAA